MSAVAVRRLVGAELHGSIDALAELRIAVFRDFPYLYDGSADYEKKYLETYLKSERCALIAAYDGDRIIGAASALPLLDETAEVQAPFRKAGIELARVFYFGESVLRKEYRGHGLGNKFFDGREEVARSFGDYDLTCFCAVQRPDDHPARPKDYRPLNGFWEKRGYRIRQDLQSEFSWKEVGGREETPHKMTYWMKEWS